MASIVSLYRPLLANLTLLLSVRDAYRLSLCCWRLYEAFMDESCWRCRCIALGLDMDDASISSCRLLYRDNVWRIHAVTCSHSRAGKFKTNEFSIVVASNVTVEQFGNILKVQGFLSTSFVRHDPKTLGPYGPDEGELAKIEEVAMVEVPQPIIPKKSTLGVGQYAKEAFPFHRASAHAEGNYLSSLPRVVVVVVVEAKKLLPPSQKT